MMLVYHDQWDKVSVTMTCRTGLSQDNSWEDLGFTKATLLTIGFSARYMEMEPNIDNMMMSEYIEYEAAKERRLWDDVRSRRSPTHYDEADFSSSHQNKSNTFYYLYSHNIPPPPVQSFPKNYLVSTEGAQGNHEAGVFQVSRDDAVVAQR
ncbi:hypothetical protein Tco_1471940, partial [Tanacetum coccineum]